MASKGRPCDAWFLLLLLVVRCFGPLSGAPLGPVVRETGVSLVVVL